MGNTDTLTKKVENYEFKKDIGEDKKIRMGIGSGLFFPDNPDKEKMKKRFQLFYNYGKDKPLDLLLFPDYFESVYNLLEKEPLPDIETQVIMYGADREHSDAIYTGSTGFCKLGRDKFISRPARYLTPYGDKVRNESDTGYFILETNQGNFAVSTGHDFLNEEIIEDNLTGIFIITFTYGTMAFINAIHKTFREKSNLQFIAFVNVAAHIPEKFHYKNRYPLALNTATNSIFWKYYELIREHDDQHYQLRENIDIGEAFAYFQLRLHTAGNAGIFCRKQSLDRVHTLRQIKEDKYIGQYCLDDDKKKMVYAYNYLSLLGCNDIIHLSSNNTIFRDYFLVLTYDQAKKTISYNTITEYESIIPDKMKKDLVTKS